METQFPTITNIMKKLDTYPEIHPYHGHSINQVRGMQMATFLNQTANCWGFYDWFCKDWALSRKSEVLSTKALQIIKLNEVSRKFNPDTSYVWFKNNCPAGWGPLYDDFRIADMETQEVIYTIVPRQGTYNNLSQEWYPRKNSGVKWTSELWGRENQFKEPLVEGTWKDILNFFKVQEAVVSPKASRWPEEGEDSPC